MLGIKWFHKSIGPRNELPLLKELQQRGFVAAFSSTEDQVRIFGLTDDLAK
jgi:hypothetical protein